MYRAFSLQLTTRLPPREMFARLLANRSWSWLERDSDRWGEYVSTSDVPGVPGARLRVFFDEPEQGRCAVNVSLDADATDGPALERRLRNLLTSTLLPEIEARDVTEIEFLE
jgi:hypothetical protein